MKADDDHFETVRHSGHGGWFPAAWSRCRDSSCGMTAAPTGFPFTEPTGGNRSRLGQGKQWMTRYRVLQPWGPDKGRQGALLSEHVSVEAAFAAIDALRAQMVRTAAPSDAIELVVADDQGNLVPRRMPR